MPETAEALIKSGYEARRSGRRGEAKALFAKAVETCAVECKVLQPEAYIGLAQTERDVSDTVNSVAHYRAAAMLYHERSQMLRFAHTIRHAADVLREDHAAPDAVLLYEQALSTYRSRSETQALDLANTLRGFALACEDLGYSTRAIEFWREAKELYQRVNVTAGVEESESHLCSSNPA